MIVCTPALTGVAARSWCALSKQQKHSDRSLQFCSGAGGPVGVGGVHPQPAGVGGAPRMRPSGAQSWLLPLVVGQPLEQPSKGEPLLGNHLPALLSILIRVPSPVKYTL